MENARTLKEQAEQRLAENSANPILALQRETENDERGKSAAELYHVSTG